MATSRIVQFVVAAAFVTAGCLALLARYPVAIVAICLCSTSFALLRRSDLTRPVPLRDIWIGTSVLALVAALCLLANLFIPESPREELMHRPVFVLPLWAMVMLGLYWRFRKESQAIDA